ncbi:MAG: RNA polymerase sigma factor [Oscillospiraceae bacterium]|nr:RNA polymerase sigma factor [Oscillospiraceae bacterium]
MNEKDFERIYREQFEPVYRYALALTRDAHAAEELTQECFFKALQAIDGFRGDCSLKTWLCGIAKNAFLSERRRTQPEPLDEQPERADEGATPELQTLQRDESLRLHRLLHELPEPYKEVFSLRVFGQLGFRDIGELFGKTENWACVVYHRARGKIQAKWEE